MKKLLLIFVLQSLCIVSFAQQSSNLKNLEQQRKQLQQEIENTNRQLSNTQRNTTTLLGRIQLIVTQIENRQQVVKLLEQEVASIATEEKEIEKEVLALEKDLESKRKSYAKAVDGLMRKRQNDNNLLFVLSGKSLTESYRRLRYLKDYSEWRSKQADEIKEKNDSLAEKRMTLTKTKSEKLALLSEKAKEEQNLKNEEQTHQKEVKESQNKQSELQKILSEKKRQAQAINKQIEKLITDEISRQESKAKKSTATTGPADTKTKTATIDKNTNILSTEEDIQLSSNFAANKGKLPYPITGTPRISAKFGKSQHSRWVEIMNDGVNLQSQAGAEARAVFKGVVSVISPIPGANNCIILRHGNYLTVYGNVQTLYVKVGDTVETGQALGKIYTDTNTSITELQFQLRQGNKKQNPELWLRK